jgi:glycosyltransferase involved in cell wall biosynthesis
MKITYILPHKKFFTNHSGRTAHAKGIVDGLIKLNTDVTLIADSKANFFFTNDNKLNYDLLSNKLNSFSFYYQIFKKIKTNKDGITIIRKSFFYIIISLLLSKKHLPKIIEINGLSNGSFQSNTFLNKLIKIILIKIQKKIILRHQYIYVVSNELKKILGNKANIKVIQNGCPDSFYNTKSLDYLNENKNLTFYFHGVLRQYNDFVLMITSFDEFSKKNKNCRLLIYGFGEMKQEIISILSDLNNHKIKYMSSISLEKLSEEKFIRGKSVGIVPLKKTIHSKLLSPIKYFNYLSLGSAVISADHGEMNEIENISTINYSAGSKHSLISAFKRYYNLGDNDWVNIFEESKIIVKNNSWEARMNELLRFAKII